VNFGHRRREVKPRDTVAEHRVADFSPAGGNRYDLAGVDGPMVYDWGAGSWGMPRPDAVPQCP
jgi:hypothetical protein